MPLIQVCNATKKYNDRIVLCNVCLTVEKGTICGIIGRNGSGKTVLLKSICGLLPLSSGVIVVNGKKIGKDIEIAESCGVLIESPGYLPNYSAYMNLFLLSKIQGIISKDIIKNTLISVGLDPQDKKAVSKYSLGMKQRLGIAQAIMENPSILILDEPMNGLDNIGVHDIRNLLLSMKEQGKTILLTSHNKEDIELLCDSVYQMDGGVLKQYNNASNVKTV